MAVILLTAVLRAYFGVAARCWTQAAEPEWSLSRISNNTGSRSRFFLSDSDFRMSSWIIFYIKLLNWEFLWKWYNFFWNFCWNRFLALYYHFNWF